MVFNTIRSLFESGRGGKYKSMSELEEKIVELRKDGHTYNSIQLKLGNPSKQCIKDTLKQYAPELLGDVIKNYGKLQPKW